MSGTNDKSEASGAGRGTHAALQAPDGFTGQITRGGDGPGTYSAVVRRVMKAGVEAVYRAWTDPAIYNQWSGGRRFVSESVEMDVRPGGRIRQTIRELETGTRWMFDGEYREVTSLRRLVFTFHWRSDAGVEHETSLVCVEFQARGPSECELTITHTQMPDEAYREGTVQGWSEWIDKLGLILRTAQSGQGHSGASQ